MSKTSFAIIVKPTVKQMRAKYTKAIGQVVKFGGLTAKIAVHLDSWVQRNFKTEGGNVGNWKPLKAGGRWVSGKSGKKRFDATAKVLQDTGRLRSSFIPYADNKIARISSDLPYAEKHHKGIGVPERQIIPKRAQVIVKVKQIADHHVRTKLRRAGVK